MGYGYIRGARPNSCCKWATQTYRKDAFVLFAYASSDHSLKCRSGSVKEDTPYLPAPGLHSPPDHTVTDLNEPLHIPNLQNS